MLLLLLLLCCLAAIVERENLNQLVNRKKSISTAWSLIKSLHFQIEKWVSRIESSRIENGEWKIERIERPERRWLWNEWCLSFFTLNTKPFSATIQLLVGTANSFTRSATYSCSFLVEQGRRGWEEGEEEEEEKEEEGKKRDIAGRFCCCFVCHSILETQDSNFKQDLGSGWKENGGRTQATAAHFCLT